jgi:hypothetical protein
VTRNLDQPAKVHGVADVLLADSVGPFLQRLQAGRPALAEPFEEIEFGEFSHA